MSKRILVVEDQPDNRKIIRDMLASVIQRPREPLRLHRR
jgi:CheY-like chemotaxis protein